MNINDIRKSVLDELHAQFPGVLAVSPGEALKAIGRTRAKDADAAARQAIYRKTFPFPIKFAGGRRVVLLEDIARTLA